MLPRLATWLRRAGGAVVALLILFEEWGWDPLQRALGRLARLPPIRHTEAAIAAAPPHWAAVLFLLPMLLLFPVKLMALRLIGQGQPVLGLAVVLLAKLVGTAVVARLYALTSPALLQLDWFAYWHARWMAWKARLLAGLRASRVWRVSVLWRRRLRRRWRSR